MSQRMRCIVGFATPCAVREAAGCDGGGCSSVGGDGGAEVEKKVEENEEQ
jgi:hypothetical protein